MKKTLSRRDFLKLTGVGLGALAFNPFKPELSALALPQFPAGDRLGRVFSKIDVHTEPSFNAPSVKVLYDDEIVVWQQEVVTRGALDPNIINQLYGQGRLVAPASSKGQPGGAEQAKCCSGNGRGSRRESSF